MNGVTRGRIIVAAMALILSACSDARQQKKADAAPEKVVYTEVDPSTAGVLTGKILFTGKKQQPKRVDMDEDPQCAKLHKTAVTDAPVAVNPDGTLANVFVYLKQGLEGKSFRPPAEPVTIDQKGCWFHPRVIGIQTGQTLNVSNSDPVTHNIHPRARVNREWNQSQDPGAAPLTRRFIRPEIAIRVKCNIHAWMRAWIAVADSPYFAVTGATGSFEIRNVPPGSYTIEAWHEELGTQQQQITVPPSGKPVVTFTFKGE